MNNKISSIGPRILGLFRNALISFYFRTQNKADIIVLHTDRSPTLHRLTAGVLETMLVPELSRGYLK